MVPIFDGFEIFLEVFEIFVIACHSKGTIKV